MITVKMDGIDVNAGPFENFAHAARWFANNGVCHGAKRNVTFENTNTDTGPDVEIEKTPGVKQGSGSLVSLKKEDLVAMAKEKGFTDEVIDGLSKAKLIDLINTPLFPTEVTDDPDADTDHELDVEIEDDQDETD
jgi:hypothetical protein